MIRACTIFLMRKTYHMLSREVIYFLLRLNKEETIEIRSPSFLDSMESDNWAYVSCLFVTLGQMYLIYLVVVLLKEF